MKQCARCGKQLNDNEQFCSACGSTAFRQIGNAQRPNAGVQRPNGNIQRPNGVNVQRPNGNMQRPNGMNVQRPNGNMQRPNGMNDMQPNAGYVNSGVQRPQQNRQMANNQNMNNYDGMQQQYGNMPQNNQFTAKPKKLSRKEKKAQEMAMMYAMQEAQRNGQYFDVDAYKREHGMVDEFSDNTYTGEASCKDWLVVLLLMLIPIVNIVICIIRMKDTRNQTMANFYKAYLVYYGAAIILSTILTVLMTVL